MCGIAGFVGSRALSEERVGATLGLMRRRGPNHAASRRFVTPRGDVVQLLHSRLSIVDLDERAHQPFTDGPLHFVVNGELYNYVELRAQLVTEGEHFQTTSDTEVFLRLLRCKADTALDLAEGMWAFAVYNSSDGSLLLSRDRFGEKPLYLYRDSTGLYFGSEVKFISSMLGRAIPVDRDQVCRYLVNGYKALYKETHTFFRGLSELPAASALRIDGDGRETRLRYWTPRFQIDDAMSYEAAVAGTRERLIQAVKIRLRADVPLAFCMSGGVDSNSLLAIAKRELGFDVHGFTIANSDARYEESELVEHAVKELDIRHTSLPTNTSDFLSQLRTLVRQHDAPIYTITYYAHWLLMRSIAEAGYKISLSGTAADELFSGYYDHHLAYLREVREVPALYAASRAAWEKHVKPEVRNPFLSDPDLFVRDASFRDHIFLDATGFAEYLTTPWSEPFAESVYSPSVLRNRMANELFHEAVPVILHEDDLNAMYFSIENRSPFLDRALFEFSTRIPTRHLLRDGRAKAVLRDSMRGIVPDPILDSRRKVGFNAPIFDFLDVKDPLVRAELLKDSPIFDLVRRDKIESLIDKAFLPNSQSKFLFYFLCAKMFLEQQSASEAPDA